MRNPSYGKGSKPRPMSALEKDTAEARFRLAKGGHEAILAKLKQAKTGGGDRAKAAEEYKKLTEEHRAAGKQPRSNIYVEANKQEAAHNERLGKIRKLEAKYPGISQDAHKQAMTGGAPRAPGKVLQRQGSWRMQHVTQSGVRGGRFYVTTSGKKVYIKN